MASHIHNLDPHTANSFENTVPFQHILLACSVGAELVSALTSSDSLGEAIRHTPRQKQQIQSDMPPSPLLVPALSSGQHVSMSFQSSL